MSDSKNKSDHSGNSELLKSLNDSSSEMIPSDAYAILEKKNDYDFNFCDYLKRVEEFDLEKLSYCTLPYDIFYPDFTSDEENFEQGSASPLFEIGNHSGQIIEIGFDHFDKFN